MKHAIRYHFSSEGGCFSESGEPVWPVCDEAEYNALAKMVSTMGGELAECLTPSSITLSGDGLVIGIGEQVKDEARLYAHLTRRRWQLVNVPQEIAEGSNISVIVALEDDIDYELLNRLYSGRVQGHAPGLVFSNSTRLLRQQVLARSAAAQLQTPTKLRRVDIFPHIPISEFGDSDWSVVGSQASAENLRAKMAACAGVLSLQSHSDGIDAFLRADLVLCPMDHEPADTTNELQPLCILSGECHRTHQPIEAARSQGKLLYPEEIRARILVLDVCWGLRPPPGVNDAAWSYTRRLLQSFNVGALLTTWEIVGTHPQVILPLTDALAMGQSVGEALADHLKRMGEAGSNHRMCLVGDPALALPAAKSVSLADKIPSHSHEMNRRRVIAPALSFLRAYILNVRRGRHGIYQDHSGEALEALERCEEALFGMRPLEEDLIEGLHTSLLDFFTGRWPVAVSTWGEFVAVSRCLEEGRACWICARPARVFEATLWTPGQPKRITVNCPNCGFIADLPLNKELQFETMAGGIIRLAGDTDEAEAAVMVESPLKRWSERWPKGDHRLLSEFQFAATLPAGPLRIAIFVIWRDFEFSVLGAGGRRETLFPSPVNRHDRSVDELASGQA